MRIACPTEIKAQENRVGLTPSSVTELCARNHEVYIQSGAGLGAGFSDQDYHHAGAQVVPDADTIFECAELIVKVKEPQASERQKLKPDQCLFTYLHLAPDKDQTRDLLASGSTCIAYETVRDKQQRLPLLAPMSEVAGRMSVQAGAHCLEKQQCGRGVLLGGVPGVEPAKVMVLGAGVVGSSAIKMAVGLGAQVFAFDASIDALRRIDDLYGNRVTCIHSNKASIERHALEADLIIGAVLIPGASAPKLIQRDLLKRLQPGAVLVDVAIDQGGCFETSKATTHENPTYVIDDVVHYCVANMPGAVARTSAQALNNATLPYLLKLADNGIRQALESDYGFLQGLNIVDGQLCCKEVAEAQLLPSITLEKALSLLK